MKLVIRALPDTLTEVPRDRWPAVRPGQPCPFNVWWSRKFLVQAYQENGVVRLSVNRCMPKPNGEWEDGITWDELQQIKRDVGYGDAWAVEIYPADTEIVNVASIRHLWVLDEPPAYAWHR